MNWLKPQKVREIIHYAETGELDRLVGVLVRLAPEEMAELKALNWLGQDRDSPRHWDALVIEAKAKVDAGTAGHFAQDETLANDLNRGLELMLEAGRI